MLAEKSPPATKTRHHCADGYRENVRHFLVCKFLHVDKQDDGPELNRKLVECCQNLTIRDLLCDGRRLYEICLKEFLVFFHQWKPEPFASLMADAVDQDLVQPRTAIRTRLEPLERTPGL